MLIRSKEGGNRCEDMPQIGHDLRIMASDRYIALINLHQPKKGEYDSDPKHSDLKYVGPEDSTAVNFLMNQDGEEELTVAVVITSDGDRKDGGRGVSEVAGGEENGKHRLKTHDVLCIKYRLMQGESPYPIARDYGVVQGTIWAISVGRTWRHISDEAVLEHHNAFKTAQLRNE